MSGYSVPPEVAEKLCEHAVGFDITDHYPKGPTVLKVGPLKWDLYRVGSTGDTFGKAARILVDIHAAIRTTGRRVDEVVHRDLGWPVRGDVEIDDVKILAVDGTVDVMPMGFITFVRKWRPSGKTGE